VLGPAIHAFLPVSRVDGEDVGGWNKLGHGEEKSGGRLKNILSRATKISPNSLARCGRGATRLADIPATSEMICHIDKIAFLWYHHRNHTSLI
jgi:hypothetical protein